MEQTRALVRLLELEFGVNAEFGRDPERSRTEMQRCREEIDPATLARYEQLKSRFGSSALVAAQDGICSGCRIALPLYQIGRLKSGMIQCDHCGRLVYSPEQVYTFQ